MNKVRKSPETDISQTPPEYWGRIFGAVAIRQVTLRQSKEELEASEEVVREAIRRIPDGSVVTIRAIDPEKPIIARNCDGTQPKVSFLEFTGTIWREIPDLRLDITLDGYHDGDYRGYKYDVDLEPDPENTKSKPKIPFEILGVKEWVPREVTWL
ncbi:MAG TPA: hypothetical protein VMR51_01135 [Patescibacteria group bacterium]|nr:hypothetical protein [Patescibacteria group bacterium]